VYGVARPDIFPLDSFYLIHLSILHYHSLSLLYTYDPPHYTLYNVGRYSPARPCHRWLGRCCCSPVSVQQTLPFNASSSFLATADFVRMALKKLPISQTSLQPDGEFRPSPEMEAEFLKHKHLGFQTPEWLESIGQKPLMGFGGEGRKMPSLSQVDEEAREKFWAMMTGENHNQKRMVKGGHGVPLSG
jgi:hypothetical protein